MKTRRAAAATATLLLLGTLLIPATTADAQGPAQVVISEIHYHPQAVGTSYPGYDDREDTEFVELLNLEPGPVDLANWCLDRAVDFCFGPGATLASNTTFVIARDAAKFEARYGFAPNATYEGRLANSGEQIRLLDGSGQVAVDVTWQTTDPWPVTPDGNGPSLELVSATGTAGNPANWAASTTIGGTPGAAPTLVTAAPPLVTSRTAPELVPAGQPIPIQATAVNTTAMTLVYNVGYGSNQSVAMSLISGSWQATLPAVGSGSLVRYRFDASGPGGVRTSPRSDDAIAWWGVAVASTPTSSVPVLDMYFTPQDWAKLAANTCGCTGAVAYEGRIWTNVAVRRVGFTSINQPKGSIRLDFPDGHPFVASFLDGPVDELTLDAGYPNTELIREKLSWAVMDAIGFPPIRNQHVKVLNNGTFEGLFLLREEQDGDWRARNNLDQGALYKVDATTDSFGFSGFFTKKEGLAEPDTDLLALRACLDLTGAPLRACMLDTVDVPQLVNEIAAVAVIRQIDQREFNYFLYRDNSQNRLWRLLPDDLDRTWGIDGGGSQLANPVVSSAQPYRRCIGTDTTPANEICRAFMRLPEFEAMYNRRLRTLTDEVLADPVWHTQLAAIAAEITTEWNADEAKWNRTSYTLTTMVDALDGWIDGYVAHLRGGGHDGLVPAAQSPAPNVTITDYRPDTGDGLGYVLLTNPSSTESVDVSNWSFVGLVEIPSGLVILPGATVAVSTDDQLFRAALPSFTGIRAEAPGTIAGQITLARRDGSIVSTAGDAPPQSLILNEWNAVGAANVIAGGDATLGSIAGNGGDWFELVVVDDNLDIRGWRLVLADADGATFGIRDEFVFADDPLLASLQAGTIITVSESFADDISFDPAFGDWTLNFQANSLDAGAYFTPESQSNFSTNHQDWQLSIFDANGALIFGPAGEGVGATTGINSAEVGELQADPSAGIDVLADYDDGASSTFGVANVAAGVAQDFSALRFGYVPGDVNCDGTMSLADALRITQLAVAIVTGVDRCPLAVPANEVYGQGGDLNRDGNTTLVDALLIAQCAVGITNIICP